eukprot:TRINITY_DN8492_c0_g1_i1.p1 TRINITY_DN8492_c0_g1~~TRINITY_DN8492_c0_g1_i1.p1  ORF type:complete len:1330 (+),score=340.61 TRINITY_DN8492_c0_g1_i1:77-4066(+)
MAFKEVQIFDPLAFFEFRTFDGADSTLSEEIGHGGGTSFKFQANGSKATRNRFIIWKTNGDILELLEYSLDLTLTQNALRISFGSVLAPSVSIYEEVNSAIHISVATLNNSLHKFTFPHPNTLQSLGRMAPSIFGTEPEKLSIAHICGRALPSFVHPIDQSNVLVGSTFGSLFIVPTQNASQEPLEIREGSKMNRLLSFMRTADEPDRKITSIAIHPVSGVVFTLSLDNKVRLWSYSDQSHIGTQTFNLSWTSDQEDIVSRHMKVYPHQDASFTACLFFATQTESQFLVLKGTGSQLAEQPTIVYRSQQTTLLDFEVANDRLWALWDDSLTFITASQDGNVEEESSWNQVYLQRPPIELPLTDKVDEFFLKNLFEAGRFSRRVIHKAIQIFTGLDLERLTTSSDAHLRDQILTSLQQRINLEVERGGDASDPNLAYSIWSRFWATCIICWNKEAAPYGLFAGPSQNVCIIRGGGLSFVRPCEYLEALDTLFAETRSTPAEVNFQFAAVTGKSIRDNDLLHLCNCLSLISEQMGSISRSMLEEDLLFLAEPSALVFQHVTDIVGGLGQNSREDPRGFVDSLLLSFRSVNRPIQAIEKLLDLFGKKPYLLSQEEIDPLQKEDAAGLLAGSTSETLVGLVFKQMCSSRFRMSMSLTVFVYALSRLRNKIGFASRDLEHLHALLPRVTKLLSSYSILNWVSNQNGIDYQTINDRRSQPNAMSSREITPTLVQLYYRAKYRYIQTHIIAATPNVHSFWNVVDAVGLDLVVAVATDSIDFGFSLLRQGQFDQLKEYLILVNSSSCLFMHLQGECYLSHKEYALASSCFSKAAARIEDLSDEERQEFIHLWSTAMQEDTNINQQSLVVQYYIGVMQSFEIHDQHQCVVDFAFEAINQVDQVKDMASGTPILPFLWSSIFKHSLEIRKFDVAYVAIISNTDPMRRSDALTRFVVYLCDEGELQLLCELPFVGLYQDVKTILEEKAHLQDIAKLPNFYHTLYSFQVYRGNHRQAASVMYEYAQRLGMESHNKDKPILQAQANSYSMAINSLRLVSSNYQWVPINASIQPSAQPASPKRKWDDEFDKDIVLLGQSIKRTSIKDVVASAERVNIANINDMEKLYALTLANIKILDTNPKMKISGFLISAEDATVLLTEESNNFDDAFSLARLYKLDLGTIFQILTKKCLGTLGNPQDRDDENPWRILQFNLEKYDAPDTNYQYHKQVALKILSTDSRIKLPNWLVHFLRDKNPSSLLRLYLQFGLYEEGAHQVLYMLHALQQSKQKSGNWLPYNLIDHLIQNLEETHTSKRYDGPHKDRIIQLKNNLDTSLKQYFAAQTR